MNRSFPHHVDDADTGGRPTFTDDEFAEYFGTPARPEGQRRRIPVWARLAGVIVAVAMLAGSATYLITTIRDFASINDPVEIRTAALDHAAQSQWGWLASDFVVVSIDESRVGAFVTNNPPDGLVQIDLRPWGPGRLDRLVDHELGHLLDFAIWGAAPASERRGGLSSEAWAECAAVDEGTRNIDLSLVDGEYHCYADELPIYREQVAALVEVCTRWGERECRTVSLGANGTSN